MPRGQKRKEVDATAIEKAASIGCTQEEVALIVGCSVRTIQTRDDLRDAYERGGLRLKTSLRRLQWEKAEAGNVTMMIWLGKQLLGQKDRVEETLRSEVIEIERIAPKAIE